MSRHIDIHAHVNFAAFNADREAVLERAREASVAMINVGTQLDTTKAAVLLAEKYEDVYAIVGLHPIHTCASHHDEKELGEGGKAFVSRGEHFDTEAYRKLLAHPKVVGIGECGLDYFRLDPASEALQRKAFSAQIALANEAGKPLMLHIRNNPKDTAHDAYADALEILAREARVKGNVHFFAGTKEHAQKFLDLGFTLSFTGVITFAKEYEELVRFVPLDMMHAETDCPYVSPTPYRGKRNEPAYVVEIIKKIAEIKGESFETVSTTLRANAKRLFGI